MSLYIHKSHNVTVLLYHLVFPAKYRRAVFDAAVDQALRDVCLGIEARYQLKFLEIGTDRDHVHFLVQSVPTYSVTKLVTTIKSLTAREIFRRCPQVKKELWGGEFWTDGYFGSTVGRHANEAMISDYVKKQGQEWLCCTDQGCERNDPSPVLGSCDADVFRASQLQHAVQDLDGDVRLGRPTLVRVRAQPVPDHALVPADGGLGSGTPVISRRLLPSHPALLGNELEMAVALCRRGLGRLARHRRGARRYDDGGRGMALGDAGVDTVLVVRPVAGE